MAERDRESEAPARGLSQLEGSGRWLVLLAAERTLLAWVRAAISLMVLGFAVDRFGLFLSTRGAAAGSGARWSSGVGLALVGAGVAASLAAAARYRHLTAPRADGDATSPRAGLRLAIALSLLLAGIGVGLAAFLVAVPPG